jgi:hypothetical protein
LSPPFSTVQEFLSVAFAVDDSLVARKVASARLSRYSCPMPKFVDNPLCSCTETDTCTSCRFCKAHDTTQGRKALCERITHFLVLEPIYQHALAQAMQTLFPSKIVYDDERDICAMLFEAVLFEDDSAGTTPFSYFVRHAPLSPDEKRLYEAWRTHTCYGFFAVEKVIRGKEVHLADLAGEHRYRVYEHRGTATIKEGSVVIARIVPFLNAWMFTTETVISFSGDGLRERLKNAYGIAIPQFLFVQKHLEDHRRRMAC